MSVTSRPEFAANSEEIALYLATCSWCWLMMPYRATIVFCLMLSGIQVATSSKASANWVRPFVQAAAFESMAITPNGDTHFFIRSNSGSIHMTFSPLGRRSQENLTGAYALQGPTAAAADPKGHLHGIFFTSNLEARYGFY